MSVGPHRVLVFRKPVRDLKDRVPNLKIPTYLLCGSRMPAPKRMRPVSAVFEAETGRGRRVPAPKRTRPASAVLAETGAGRALPDSISMALGGAFRVELQVVIVWSFQGRRPFLKRPFSPSN